MFISSLQIQVMCDILTDCNAREVHVYFKRRHLSKYIKTKYSNCLIDLSTIQFFS